MVLSGGVWGRWLGHGGSPHEWAEYPYKRDCCLLIISSSILLLKLKWTKTASSQEFNQNFALSSVQIYNSNVSIVISHDEDSIS